MDPQTEKEPAPHKKTPPGWLWWSLLGAGLYVLDQASKLWIIRRFPLNYLNEKLHKYAYLPDFPGFSHINADGTLDFATNGRMPEAELARLPDLNPNTVDALNKLRELEPISFLDGTMNITRVHNTGVAFGLGNGTVWSSYLFLAVPVLAIVVLVVLYRKNLFHTAWLKLAYVLLLAGVAGNLTDRLIQGFLIPYEQQHGFFTKLMNGYVVDFIDVTIPLFNYRWPAFNVADSCIFVAAIIFFIASIFSAKNKEEKTSWVTISKIHVSCDCTTAGAKDNKLTYAPGESGVISAVMKTGNFSGTVDKDMTVHANGSAYKLVIRAQIPDIIRMEPRKLEWARGEAAVPKTIKITISKELPVNLTTVDLTGDAFDYEPVTVKKGREYKIIVTPKSTARPAFNTIWVRTDSAVPRYKRQMGFLAIKEN